MPSKLLLTRSCLHSASRLPGSIPLVGLTHGKSCSAEVGSQNNMENFALSQLYDILFNQDLIFGAGLELPCVGRRLDASL